MQNGKSNNANMGKNAVVFVVIEWHLPQCYRQRTEKNNI